MKFTPLSVIAAAIFLVSSPVSLAASISDNILQSNDVQSFVVPPLIAERLTMPTKIPKANLYEKNLDTMNNAVLPENVEQMYGLALNASSIDLGSSYNGLSRRSNVFATDSQVAELKPSTQLAANSYCRSVIPFSKWSCKHCSKDETLVKTFKSSKWDTNGFVSRNDKTKVITLVFRGSSSIRNAIADIKLSLAEYPPVVDAKVHNGFYQSYMEVQKEVLSTMFKEISAYPDYKIVVTGHSLGAATAVLAALDLFQRDDRFNSKNLSIITYGEPRVGNPAFAYYMTGTGIRHDRVVHKQDLVAHIPSKRLGYLHSGVEYWNIIGDTVKICADELDSDDCSNSIVPFTSFLDHATYLKINTGFCL